MNDNQTLYEAIGGDATLRRLVEAFYPRVQADPDLAPIFPADIDPVMEKQYRFLTQFLGGPALYSMLYGAPALRMRHLPHPVTPVRAQAWLRCMAAAMDEIGLHGPDRDDIFRRLTTTAQHMVNTREP